MKKIIFLFAALACCVCTFAQNNLVFEPVLLTLDKTDGKYAVGEIVNVYGQITQDYEGDLVCVVESNGKILQRPLKVDLKKEKTVIYTAAFDSPSAVQVYVFPKGNDSVKAAVGFVVDAGSFLPGFDDPKDFEKFEEHYKPLVAIGCTADKE